MSNRLVVVGSRDPGSWDAGYAHIAYTDDLISWTQVDLSSLVAQDSALHEVVFVEEWGWVACGFEHIGDFVYEALVLQSEDGETWNKLPYAGSERSALNIQHHDGLWVMSGANNFLWTSTDLETWTPRTTNLSSSAQGLRGLKYANDTWIVTGGSGQVATSSDGITWTQRSSGTSEVLWGLDFNGVFWWAFSRVNATIQSTTNGEDWIQGSNVDNSANSIVRDAVWAQNRWHVVSDAGRVYKTDDAFGSNWTFSQVQGVNGHPNQNRFLHYGNGVWVWGGTGWWVIDGSQALGYYVATSSDAENWTVHADAWWDRNTNFTKTTDGAAWGHLPIDEPPPPDEDPDFVGSLFSTLIHGVGMVRFNRITQES